MKKIIYIIPGQGETCELLRYKNLAFVLSHKGYKIKAVNPNWYKPLSGQIFPVEKDAIIIGFSLGAVLAYLIAKKYPCQKIILASLSPIHTFPYEHLVADMRHYMNIEKAIKVAKDIKNIHISLSTLPTPYVTLVGELEKKFMGTAHFIVPNSGHRLTPKYIKCIQCLI